MPYRITSEIEKMTLAKYFDPLDYIRKARELKDPEALAEYQVRQMEMAMEALAQQVKEEMNHLREEIDIKDLVTKKDLELSESRLTIKIEREIPQVHLEIPKLRVESIKFIIWTGVGVVSSLGGILGGMIAHGFGWI